MLGIGLGVKTLPTAMPLPLKVDVPSLQVRAVTVHVSLGAPVVTVTTSLKSCGVLGAKQTHGSVI